MTSAPILSESDIERFWSKVDKRGDEECWMWRGAALGLGYGGFAVGGRNLYAHRVSLMLKTGEWPHNAATLHSCDVPRCVNPSHLRAGTQLENVRDCHERGRAARARGEDSPRSRLTTAAVAEIRIAYDAGASWSDIEEIADGLGVTPACVWQAATRRTWKHIP